MFNAQVKMMTQSFFLAWKAYPPPPPSPLVCGMSVSCVESSAKQILLARIFYTEKTHCHCESEVAFACSLPSRIILYCIEVPFYSFCPVVVLGRLLAYIRDGWASTIECAATLRQKWQPKLAISPSGRTLPPGQPVPALTIRVPGARQGRQESTNV